MPFNRIIGYYVGGFSQLEPTPMSISDENNELNEVVTNRLGQLQEAINAKEAELKSMLVASDVAYVYHKVLHEGSRGERVGETWYSVGMLKWQGAWRLCHGTETIPGLDYTDWKPLVDSSIPDRLRAVPHLAELKRKIVESKKALVPEIEAAIELVAKSLDKGSAAPQVRPKQKRTRRTSMVPTDKQIRDVDSISAIMQDDSDILRVYLNPDIPIEVPDGQPYHRPRVLAVTCNSADDLFALRTRVRQLRGDEGMVTIEQRRDELENLMRTDMPALLRVHECRTGVKYEGKTAPSELFAVRMIGDILNYEHAGE